jgi:hypothetical protein
VGAEPKRTQAGQDRDGGRPADAGQSGDQFVVPAQVAGALVEPVQPGEQSRHVGGVTVGGEQLIRVPPQRVVRCGCPPSCRRDGCRTEIHDSAMDCSTDVGGQERVNEVEQRGFRWTAA